MGDSSHQTPRGRLLAKVRNALMQSTPQPYPDVDPKTAFYHRTEALPEVQFAEQFTRWQGHFQYCENLAVFLEDLQALTEQEGWHHLFVWDHFLQELFVKNRFKQARIGRDLGKADVGVTLCEALVARTGSVLLSSKLASGRSLPIFPPVHLVVAFADQVVDDLPAGLRLMREKYSEKLPSMIYFATGPSRTADIEKTLVLGAHGPKTVYVFLIDKRGM